jgi:hypothetical protein
VPGRDGAVSFGFVYSLPPEKLAAKLKSNKMAKEILAEDRPSA